MKYIRTKDNVWQYDRNKNVVRPSEDGKSIVYWLHFDEKEILKSADTIEELCDEIVVYNRNSKKPYLLEDWQRKSLFEQKVKPDFITAIYGAIWTDIGLIYVAKMNDKGELELI